MLALPILLVALGCGGPRRVRAANPVNVVLIVVDTLRPDFLGCYGASDSPSPNLDALAADGILFEDAIAHAPITGPSHASLLTSRYPSELGVVNNAATRIPDHVPVLAELLREAGFYTGASVAIAPIQRRWGFERGFDRFEDRLQRSWMLPAEKAMARSLDLVGRLEEPFLLWSHLADPHEPYNAHGLVHREAEVMANGTLIGQVSTSSSSARSLELELEAGKNRLEIRSDHPFWVRRLSLKHRGWIKPTLDPEHPDPGYVEEYRVTIRSTRPRSVELVVQLSDLVEGHEQVIERYRREVRFADRHVGLLIRELRARGLYEDALVIFTSDHGEGLGCHGYGGHVQTLYDCMVRVPLLLKPPGGAGSGGGRRISGVVGLVDLLPTILGSLQLETRAEMRGRDLFDSSAAPARPAVFMETHRPQAEKTLFGLRGDRFVVIFEPGARRWELYDVQLDPEQKTDLFDPQASTSVSWQGSLLSRLRRLPENPGGHAEPDPLDETRQMLRSLGYLTTAGEGL